jgi:hypothetical protein
MKGSKNPKFCITASPFGKRPILDSGRRCIILAKYFKVKLSFDAVPAWRFSTVRGWLAVRSALPQMPGTLA